METTSSNIANFLYVPGDLTLSGQQGAPPRVKQGNSLTFVNADQEAGIRHTVTTCPWPCNGRYMGNYPLPDGTWDSGTLGYDAIDGGNANPVASTPTNLAVGKYAVLLPHPPVDARALSKSLSSPRLTRQSIVGSIRAAAQPLKEFPLKICVLVKQVPDAAVEKRMDSNSKRLDRSGETNLNPFDTHAIEAAMQIKEGGKVDVEEIVAVTMGPESAFRALHKAVSLGADRSVHLTDDALAGSDVCATGYALAKVLEAESPDLVLLGQQSDDGECYTIGAVVADHLKMPSLTQVIEMEADAEKLTCRRQAEYGYDTVEVALPAVISVGDAINEPRYPSLKAIMGAKKKPLDTKSTSDVGIEADKVGEQGSRTAVLGINPPPEKQAGEIIEDEDTNETVEKIVAWLEERKLLA